MGTQSGVDTPIIKAMVSLGRWSWGRYHHLAQSLLPAAGCGVFLGLSTLTVTMLRGEGLVLGWVGFARGTFLLAASLWSLRLAWLIAKRYSASRMRQALAAASVALALAAADGGWILFFWVW